MSETRTADVTTDPRAVFPAPHPPRLQQSFSEREPGEKRTGLPMVDVENEIDRTRDCESPSGHTPKRMSPRPTSGDVEWTGTEWRPKPLSPRDVEWGGTGWRIWRVELREGRPTLRNPWTNSPQLDWWEPVHSRFSVQVAVCFWNTNWHNLVPSCRGYLTAQCSCGIRSMMTLGHLATFLARDRQLDRHPEKAAVVGRIRIGGRVQHAIPGRKPIEGYQRSEFAELLGPLYVSPRAAHWFADLDRTYGFSKVVAPDMSRADAGEQAWLEQLAEEATQ